TQSIELSDRPDRVHVDLRADNYVRLLVYLREVDIVVVFDPGGDAETEADRTDEQIIWDVFDRLVTSFGRFFAGERRSDRILSAKIGQNKQEEQKHRAREAKPNCDWGVLVHTHTRRSPSRLAGVVPAERERSGINSMPFADEPSRRQNTLGALLKGP